MRVSLPEKLRRSPTKLLIVAYVAAHTPVGYTTLRRDCASSGARAALNRFDGIMRELENENFLWIGHDERGWRTVGITQTGRRALARSRIPK